MVDDATIPPATEAQEPVTQTNYSVTKPVALRCMTAETARQRYAARNDLSFAQERSAKPRYAIFITHGMGQQIVFETLDALCQGLRAETARMQGVSAATIKPRAKTIKIEETHLNRLEIDLRDKDGKECEVHLYEGYWSPLTQGKVSLKFIILFLISTGWHGIKNSVIPFRRWLFGEYAAYRIGLRTSVGLLLAVLTVIALVILNFTLVTVAAARSPLNQAPAWLSRELFSDLTTSFDLVVSAAVCYTLLFFVGDLARAFRLSVTFRRGVATLSVAVFILTLLMAIGSAATIPLLFYPRLTVLPMTHWWSQQHQMEEMLRQSSALKLPLGKLTICQTTQPQNAQFLLGVLEQQKEQVGKLLIIIDPVEPNLLHWEAELWKILRHSQSGQITLWLHSSLLSLSQSLLLQFQNAIILDPALAEVNLMRSVWWDVPEVGRVPNIEGITAFIFGAHRGLNRWRKTSYLAVTPTPLPASIVGQPRQTEIERQESRIQEKISWINSPTNPMEQSTLLLHLSDIHFHKKNSGGIYDPDKDLRNELERDAAAFCARNGNVKNVLITGDIAYAGQTTEYEKAGQWLQMLCEKIGCNIKQVWMTPGNHDVDRSIVEGDRTLRLYRDQLRKCTEERIDDEIKALMEDATAQNLLFRPLEQYNIFAANYGCEINATRPFWQQDILLNDGSTLRVLGLNSALISDKLDHRDTHKLVLGTIPSLPQNFDGVEYLTLCHHPIDWLRDSEDVDRNLNARVRLQLFGHKHLYRLVRMNESLRIGAGAVHPERLEQKWVPRYNFIKIRVGEKDGSRQLEVELFPRVWYDDEKKFAPDYGERGNESSRYSLPIRAWQIASTRNAEPVNHEATNYLAL